MGPVTIHTQAPSQCVQHSGAPGPDKPPLTYTVRILELCDQSLQVLEPLRACALTAIHPPVLPRRSHNQEIPTSRR